VAQKARPYTTFDCPRVQKRVADLTVSLGGANVL